MPTRILQIASVVETTVNVSAAIDSGILEAVTISVFENTVPSGSAYARIVVQSGTNTLENTIAQLASGYPSTGWPLSWIGRFHLEAEDRVTFYITGYTNFTARCSIRVHHED